MFDAESVKTRFVFSFISNAIRGSIGFATGILVARGLMPSGYGDFTFLLGSFAAFRSLLDMGSSNAFYTFICQRKRTRGFYLSYLAWLVFQLALTMLLLAVFMPTTIIEKVWLGHSIGVILLAFAASFMQQQVWQTFSQIWEAERKTVQVQIIGMAVSIGHLLLVLLLLIFWQLTVSALFGILILEYLLVILWACSSTRGGGSVSSGPAEEAMSFQQLLREYWKFCKPLVLLSGIGFLYEFSDRWLLQRFGGATQQGYYQIAFQFSALTLLATSSILNVFWKEIAEADQRGDKERVAFIYHRVSRGLIMFGSVLSGLLIPWTKQIVAGFLGSEYTLAVPVLLVMFLYPIHQSMGQIGGTMLLATGNTRGYTFVSAMFMLLSLPISYLVLAPPSGFLLPGLGLGAIGIALKMVLLNIASVNVQAWIIARERKWKFSWFYQVVGILAVVGLGCISKFLVGLVWTLPGDNEKLGLLLPFLLATLLYLVMVAGLLRTMPWLIGMTKLDMTRYLVRLKSYCR